MLTVNPDYIDSKKVSSSNFMGHPSIFLKGMEAVREAIDHPWWKKEKHPFEYRVKSDWIISLIDEIEASGKYPYNACVKTLARERLGLPRLSDRENAQEGDALSTLIYNAQNFRRSDQLVANGFSPLTEDMLVEAFEKKRKIALSCGTLLTVRKVGERLYAFKPRKRKYAVMLGYDTPAKIA